LYFITIDDAAGDERVTSIQTLVSGVTRVPGAGVCPVTVGVMRCKPELSEEATKAPGAVLTPTVFNPEEVTRLVASGRVIPVRSGMA
jgi:hypothetical protein